MAAGFDGASQLCVQGLDRIFVTGMTMPWQGSTRSWRMVRPSGADAIRKKRGLCCLLARAAQNESAISWFRCRSQPDSSTRRPAQKISAQALKGSKKLEMSQMVYVKPGLQDLIIKPSLA